jgi:hypothetical protein
MNNNPLPLPSLPTQETIDSIISYAPQPVRPIARKTFAWLKQKLTPFDVPEPGEHSTSVTGADPTDYEEGSSPEIDSGIEDSQKNRYVDGDIKAKPEKGQMSMMFVIDSPKSKPKSNRKLKISKAFVPSVQESRTDTSPPLLISKLSKRTPPFNTRVPTPPSPMKMSAPILAGSEFVLPTKVRIHPEEQARVAAELKEAIEDNEFFFNRWPTYEDSRIMPPAPPPSSPKMFDGPPVMICPPKTTQAKASPTPKTLSTQNNDRKYASKGKQKQQQQQGEASAMYTRKLTASETSRRDRIKKQWADKEERDISKRGRVEGGLEDTVENAMLADMSMFTPTLYGVQLQPSEVVLGWSDRVVRPGDQRVAMKRMEESVRSLAIEGEDSDSDDEDEDESFEDVESGIEDGEGGVDRGRGVESSREKQEGKRKHCYRKEKPKQKQMEHTQQNSDSEASFRRLPRIRRRSKPMEDVQRADGEPEQPISREKEQSSDSNLTRSGIQQRPTPRQKRESEEDTDNRLAYGLEDL